MRPPPTPVPMTMTSQRRAAARAAIPWPTVAGKEAGADVIKCVPYYSYLHAFWKNLRNLQPAAGPLVIRSSGPGAAGLLLPVRAVSHPFRRSFGTGCRVPRSQSGLFPNFCVTGGSLLFFAIAASVLSETACFRRRSAGTRQRDGQMVSALPMERLDCRDIDNRQRRRIISGMGTARSPRGVSRRSRFTSLKHFQTRDRGCLRLMPLPATSFPN